MKKEWYELYIGETLIEKFYDKRALLDAHKELKEEGHKSLSMRYCTRSEFYELP